MIINYVPTLPIINLSFYNQHVLFRPNPLQYFLVPDLEVENVEEEEEDELGDEEEGDNVVVMEEEEEEEEEEAEEGEGEAEEK